MSERASAYRDAADFLEKFGNDTYAIDIFVTPTSEQYAEINALLKRERGHQLDGIAADCMRRAYTVAAKLLRERAVDIEELELDREHMTCHRNGALCSWDGCPRQYDDRACEGCFLIQPEGDE